MVLSLPKMARWLALSIAFGSILASCQRRSSSFAVAPPTGRSETAARGVAGPMQEPPGDKWLKDDHGNEYSIQRIPKNEAQRIDQKTVRNLWGLRLEIVKEDGNFYYYKVYRPIVTPRHAAGD
jgi:hypothetical protein